MRARPARPTFARRDGGVRAWVAGLLLASLLLAQALALVHRVVHAGGTGPAPAATLATAAGTHGAEDAPGLARLFAGHADDAGCRLYDALGHEGLPWAAPAAPVAVPAPARVAAQPPGCASAPPTAFHARGPPVRT